MDTGRRERPPSERSSWLRASRSPGASHSCLTATCSSPRGQDGSESGTKGGCCRRSRASPARGGGEGGLLDIVPDPSFATTRLFYVYVTKSEKGSRRNDVERWRLAEDGKSAALERVIFS